VGNVRPRPRPHRFAGEPVALFFGRLETKSVAFFRGGASSKPPSSWVFVLRSTSDGNLRVDGRRCFAYCSPQHLALATTSAARRPAIDASVSDPPRAVRNGRTTTSEKRTRCRSRGRCPCASDRVHPWPRQRPRNAVSSQTAVSPRSEHAIGSLHVRRTQVRGRRCAAFGDATRVSIRSGANARRRRVASANPCTSRGGDGDKKCYSMRLTACACALRCECKSVRTPSSVRGRVRA